MPVPRSGSEDSEPGNARFLNTLGVVQYPNGQYREAVATLAMSLATGRGESDGFDLFLLAMCHARLGSLAVTEDGSAAVDIVFAAPSSGEYGIIVPMTHVATCFGSLELVTGHGV